MRDRPNMEIDASLVERVAALSAGTQRWLKTTIHAISSSDAVPPPLEAGTSPGAASKAPPRPKPASLEDVVSGRADLREHLEAYPELSGELEGLADVIDLLREAGERRRRRGEQILREEILGEPPEEEHGPR